MYIDGVNRRYKKDMKYIEENTVIHCATYESAVAVLGTFHHYGFKWNTGESYSTESNYRFHKENTCYYPVKGVFSSLDYFKRNGYKIIDSDTYLRGNVIKMK